MTLHDVPGSLIEQSEQRGLDWTRICLETQDVELTLPRDTEEDAAKMVGDLRVRYAWSFLGEPGKRIRQVLAHAEDDDLMAALEVWQDYLEENLTFSFEAKVSEHSEWGPLQAGDRVTVRGISRVDDFYGIIIGVTYRRSRRRRTRYDFPLYDLEVTDEHSQNHQIVNDYSVWFAHA